MKPPFAASANIHTPSGGETIFPHQSFSFMYIKRKGRGSFGLVFPYNKHVYAHLHMHVYLYMHKCACLHFCMTCHHFPSGNQSGLKAGYTHTPPILRLLTQCPQLSRGLREHQSWCLYNIPSICYKVRNFKQYKNAYILSQLSLLGS